MTLIFHFFLYYLHSSVKCSRCQLFSAFFLSFTIFSLRDWDEGDLQRAQSGHRIRQKYSTLIGPFEKSHKLFFFHARERKKIREN